MYYIFLQLKNKGRGDNAESKGSVWITSGRFKSEELELFCNNEKAELLCTVSSYKKASGLVQKFWKKAQSTENVAADLDIARKFFHK